MNKIRMAIIGCGGYAGAHARRLKEREDVVIAALCSRHEESIEDLISRRLTDYPVPIQKYTSTAEMYKNTDLDGVVICTPHNLHFPQAAEAIDRGCHALIEKPMVTSVKEARELKRISREHGSLKIGVCYNTAYAPGLDPVRSALKDGRYGKLELITAYLAQNWKTLTAGSWRQDPEVSGGGQIVDSGAHLAHSILSLAGADPEEVFAYSANNGGDVDVNSVISIRFKNGVFASVTVGGNSVPDGSFAAFIFEKGRIEADAWRGEWCREIGEDGTVTEHTDFPEANPDANFIDAVLGKDELKAGAADGLTAAAFTEAVFRSVREGKPEKAEL
ncbi:MAG: Gfo/Idh/MocA family protein [Spirochaetia bacterium]